MTDQETLNKILLLEQRQIVLETKLDQIRQKVLKLQEGLGGNEDGQSNL